jgi:ribosomal protein S18 acetylase RimI-like enzyme
MNGAKETPEEALKREIQEEFGVNDVKLTFIKNLPGPSQWKDKKFATLNNFYLTEINGDIHLNEENSEFKFVDLKNINPKDIAFESNQKMVEWLKENFTFDMERVKELVRQLDPSTLVNEQSLYKAMLDGFLSKIYEGEKLIGMGWIFPRQTLSRKQAVVEDMIVDNAYRGKGYGKKMLLELINFAKKEGMDMIELTSHPSRIAANELYKKCGFVLHQTNHYLYKF